MMRKKSHILLARYLVQRSKSKLLRKHKIAFYVGCILPDCRPSFFTTKHEIQNVFPLVKHEIQHMTELDSYDGKGRSYCKALGQVIHYLSDCFTFSHNENFKGGIRRHCAYEKQQYLYLRAWIRNDNILGEDWAENLETLEEICGFIQKTHRDYLQKDGSLEVDCQYIVSLCHEIVKAILDNSFADEKIFPFYAKEVCYTNPPTKGQVVFEKDASTFS